jgi:hypothetical protein
VNVAPVIVVDGRDSLCDGWGVQRKVLKMSNTVEMLIVRNDHGLWFARADDLSVDEGIVARFMVTRTEAEAMECKGVRITQSFPVHDEPSGGFGHGDWRGKPVA